MAHVLRKTNASGTTLRFEGADHGAQASFFLVDIVPGQVSGLHEHPYPETWIVRAGRAAFEIGGETIRADAGDIIVGPARIPHKFTAMGPDRLELVCIHPAARIEQTDLEEPRPT